MTITLDEIVSVGLTKRDVRIVKCVMAEKGITDFSAAIRHIIRHWKSDKSPDPLGQALNEGDGVYRP